MNPNTKLGYEVTRNWLLRKKIMNANYYFIKYDWYKIYIFGCYRQYRSNWAATTDNEFAGYSECRWRSSTGHSQTWFSGMGWWCCQHGGSRTPPRPPGAAPRREGGWSRSLEPSTGVAPRHSSPRTLQGDPSAPRSPTVSPCSNVACIGDDGPSCRFSSSSWCCGLLMYQTQNNKGWLKISLSDIVIFSPLYCTCKLGI